MIGIYLRLSKADQRGRESESIENQRTLLQQYIKEDTELSALPCIEYCDDGYSGMERKRPALNNLLYDIEKGKIAYVLAKDMSRISRDYIFVSYLMELYFPEHDVRLVLPGEGYDERCAKEYQLYLRFQSVFNEYYARDISRKVKSALSAKKNAGEYAVAKPPFGYRKNQHGEWEICDKEALVVRFAFSYAAQGKKNVEICEAWKRKGNGVNMYPVLVGRILSNPVYCGFYVWHKYETVPYCHGKSRRLKEREWCVQKGRQEAIISVFLFRKVQKIRGRESLV